MTSQFSQDAIDRSFTEAYSLASDKEGFPLQGQVPVKTAYVTASGAFPAQCPETVVLKGAAAITLTAANLLNLCGRRIKFVCDGVNTPAHVIQFPANSFIDGTHSRATFNVAAGAVFECEIADTTQPTVGTLRVIPLYQNQVVIS